VTALYLICSKNTEQP